MAPPPCLRRGSKIRSWCAEAGPVAGTDVGETLKQHLDVMLSRLYRLSTTHKKSGCSVIKSCAAHVQYLIFDICLLEARATLFNFRLFDTV